MMLIGRSAVGAIVQRPTEHPGTQIRPILAETAEGNEKNGVCYDNHDCERTQYLHD